MPKFNKANTVNLNSIGRPFILTPLPLLADEFICARMGAFDPQEDAENDIFPRNVTLVKYLPDKWDL